MTSFFVKLVFLVSWVTAAMAQPPSPQLDMGTTAIVPASLSIKGAVPMQDNCADTPVRRAQVSSLLSRNDPGKLKTVSHDTMRAGGRELVHWSLDGADSTEGELVGELEVLILRTGGKTYYWCGDWWKTGFTWMNNFTDLDNGYLAIERVAGSGTGLLQKEMILYSLVGEAPRKARTVTTYEHAFGPFDYEAFQLEFIPRGIVCKGGDCDIQGTGAMLVSSTFDEEMFEQKDLILFEAGEFIEGEVTASKFTKFMEAVLEKFGIERAADRDAYHAKARAFFKSHGREFSTEHVVKAARRWNASDYGSDEKQERYYWQGKFHDLK